MSQRKQVSFKAVQLSCVTYLLSLLIFTSCTPFKMDKYKECTQDSDCLSTFERCDLYNFCVSEGSSCYWQLADGQQLSDYTPQDNEVVIGLLADHDLVAVSGPAWPAIVGLQTGVALSQQAESPSASIIVCDPSSTVRDSVLETFSRYNVKTVIGESLGNETDSQARVYLSISLTDQDQGKNIGSSSPVAQSFHLRLGSSPLEVTQAFEYLSTKLLDHLSETSNERNFISMLTLQNDNQSYSADYIERLTWRLSPYSNSLFRTLIIYFDEFFKIDEVITDFLNSVSPLQYFVSLDPLSTAQLSELIDTAQRKTTVTSTTQPLKLLAYKWRVDQSSIPMLTFWPKLLQYTVIAGQYPHLYYDSSHENFAKWQDMYAQAQAKAIEIDSNLSLPAPYFGLAYDAGFLASLIHNLSNAERTPYQVFNMLVQRDNSEAPDLFLDSDTVQNSFDGGSAWEIMDFNLQGLSGALSAASSTKTLAPLMLCSQNGTGVQASPFKALEEPVEVGTSTDGNDQILFTIMDYFELADDQAHLCD